MSFVILVSNLYAAAGALDLELMFGPFGVVAAVGLVPRDAPPPAGRRGWVAMRDDAGRAAAVRALDGAAFRGHVLGCAAARRSATDD